MLSLLLWIWQNCLQLGGLHKKVDGFREYTYRPAKKGTKEYNFSNERGQVQSI